MFLCLYKMALLKFMNFALIILLVSSLPVNSLQWQSKRSSRLNKVGNDYMNVTQLITSNGYPCEEHNVQTVDGFILGVQRIPHGKAKNANINRPVVLLQHGLLSCSSCWVENLANESLGFLLADAGMDVWLGNNRGNKYASNHVKYSSTDEEFWAFSFDEMAKYDLPAMINYIINITNCSQIYFVGHSQGNLQAFAAFSQNKDLGKKVKLFFALAPITSMANNGSPIRLLIQMAGNNPKGIFKLQGTKEFLPNNYTIQFLAADFCDPELGEIVCRNILFVLGGYNNEVMNKSRVPLYVEDNPAGTSVQNIVHMSQEIDSGKFQMYNFGSADKNKEHYNQTKPPMYSPDQMETPVALFTGSEDWFADENDVKDLIPKLKHNLVFNKIIPDWQHLDFVWAMNAKTECYDEIINLINKYEK